MFQKLRLVALLIVLIPGIAKGQLICSVESRARLDSVFSVISAMDVSQNSMNELTVKIGILFLNTPYVEKTLEIQGDESLVINVTGLDCSTFLESVVTLARITKLSRLSVLEYARGLEFLRYRDGIINEYPSRLHYFSDWIYDNQKKGVLQDITKDIGGVVFKNSPTFMSSHPGSYSQLSNEKFVEQIKIAEAGIASRTYYYVPKEFVESLEKKILPGDLIAITIAMDNLDISHVGIAVEQNGRIHLLHASSNSMKVEISEKPLSDYLMSHKSQSGIMVCRLVEPK